MLHKDSLHVDEGTGALLESSADEALRRNHKYVTPLHFLWALYHIAEDKMSPVLEKIVKILEDWGVNASEINDEFAEDDVWSKCERYEGGLNRYKAAVSLDMQNILDLAALVAGENVVTILDIVRVMLSRVGGQAVELLQRCRRISKKRGQKDSDSNGISNLLVDINASIVEANEVPGSTKSHVRRMIASPPSTLVPRNSRCLRQEKDQDHQEMPSTTLKKAEKKLNALARDSVNCVRFVRRIQNFSPLLSGYEAWLLQSTVAAIERGSSRKMKQWIKLSLKDCTVGKIFVFVLDDFEIILNLNSFVRRNLLLTGRGHLPIAKDFMFPLTKKYCVSYHRSPVDKAANRITLRGSEEKNDSIGESDCYGFDHAKREHVGVNTMRRRLRMCRDEIRLPSDETVYDEFIFDPAAALLKNGFEHCIGVVSNHWRNTLSTHYGVFAMAPKEKLDPFEALRFYLPVSLVHLSILRGVNEWDSDILIPFTRKLQSVNAQDDLNSVREIIKTCKEDVVFEACSGLVSRVDPLSSWLDCILDSLDLLEEIAFDVKFVLASVGIELKLGCDVVSQADWTLPSDETMEMAVLSSFRGDGTPSSINLETVTKALSSVSDRDKQSIFELHKLGLESSFVGQQLLNRAKSLLRKQIRREAIDDVIKSMSVGQTVSAFEEGEKYWLVDSSSASTLYIYRGKAGREQADETKSAASSSRTGHLFQNSETGEEILISQKKNSFVIRSFVPVAEGILLAQKALMTIEVDHLKHFNYNALMEVSTLRDELIGLLIISHLQSNELDDARHSSLQKAERNGHSPIDTSELVPGERYYVQNDDNYDPFLCEEQYSRDHPDWGAMSKKRVFRCLPQSLIVIGRKPSMLLAMVHCIENTLSSGGDVVWYDVGDRSETPISETKFVRLDNQCIRMLLYHLGTPFADLLHLSIGVDELTSQQINCFGGRIYVDREGLENALQSEAKRLVTSGLIRRQINNGAEYDAESNHIKVSGASLEVGDVVLRKVDPNGNVCEEFHPWKVSDQVYIKALATGETLRNGEFVYSKAKEKLLRLWVARKDPDTQKIKFERDNEAVTIRSGTDIDYCEEKVDPGKLVRAIEFRCLNEAKDGSFKNEIRPFRAVANKKFPVERQRTHVIGATNVYNDDKLHFSFTPSEPYGLCCVHGVRHTMQAGSSRLRPQIVLKKNDTLYRKSLVPSQLDVTTAVESGEVSRILSEFLNSEDGLEWMSSFEKLLEDAEWQQTLRIEASLKLKTHLENFSKLTSSSKASRLLTHTAQVRDCVCLTMEFTREFRDWKESVLQDIVTLLPPDPTPEEKRWFEYIVARHLDKLWFVSVLNALNLKACFSTSAKSDASLCSSMESRLGKLSVGDTFFFPEDPSKQYEFLIKEGDGTVIIRNNKGQISSVQQETKVFRDEVLSLGEEGESQSKVQVSTFDLSHRVNLRALRVNDEVEGFVSALVGDDQCTTHFMQHGYLTNACSHVVVFNKFLYSAIHGSSFDERFREYSREISWSNGEVVSKGTGAGYGDGYLRPGFSYAQAVDFLHSRVLEHCEAQQDISEVLDRKWSLQFAASLVPRGMEMNQKFTDVLTENIFSAIFEKLVTEVQNDKVVSSEQIVDALRRSHAELKSKVLQLEPGAYWEELLRQVDMDDAKRRYMQDLHIIIAKCLEIILTRVIDTAREEYIYNTRISSEVYQQPKALDSLVDETSLEAQVFVNNRTWITVLAAIAVSCQPETLVGGVIASIFAGTRAFETIVHASRYKNRNEESLQVLFDEKVVRVSMRVYSLMNLEDRSSIALEHNPYFILLEPKMEAFVNRIRYYRLEEPVEFLTAYGKLVQNINDSRSVKNFMHQIATEFIPGRYHVNSQLQEDLVGIYYLLDDLTLSLWGIEDANAEISKDAAFAFQQVLKMRPALEVHLRSKCRHLSIFSYRHVFAAIRHVVGQFMCVNSKPRAGCCAGSRPLALDILAAMKSAQHLADVADAPPELLCAIQDLALLYQSTAESTRSSAFIIGSWTLLITSIFFIVSIFVPVPLVQTCATWAFGGIAAVLGVTSSIMPMNTRLMHLFLLQRAVKKRIPKAEGLDEDYSAADLILVKRLINAKVAVSTLSLSACIGAIMAILGTLVSRLNVLPAEVDLLLSSMFVAAASLWIIALATAVSFVLECRYTHRMSSTIGACICEAFRSDIEDMSHDYSIPMNNIETRQEQEREVWEYAARQFMHSFRFDTVFSPRRLSSIFDYILGGMDQDFESKSGSTSSPRSDVASQTMSSPPSTSNDASSPPSTSVDASFESSEKQGYVA